MTAGSTSLRLGRVPLIDGIDKVSGRARYTADLDHADALIGRILRSPISHGIIARIDVAKLAIWPDHEA